jgi:hypothetical protein
VLQRRGSRGGPISWRGAGEAPSGGGKGRGGAIQWGTGGGAIQWVTCGGTPVNGIAVTSKTASQGWWESGKQRLMEVWATATGQGGGAGFGEGRAMVAWGEGEVGVGRNV